MPATRGANGAKSPGPKRPGAKRDSGRTAERAVAREEKALDSRIEGKSFVKIASQLEFATASEALAAYRRALRRRTAEEQASIRDGERKRLDAMERAVRADADLAPDARARRLARIQRLRAALA